MLLIRGMLFLLLFGVIVSGPMEAQTGLNVTSMTVNPTRIEAGHPVTLAATSRATTAVVYATLQANEPITETYNGTIPADTAAGSDTVHAGSASTTFRVSSATPVNGACGSVNGTGLARAPTTDLCSAGTASVVTGTGTGPWRWTCSGSNGGVTTLCHALVDALPVLIQHVSSSANPAGAGISGNNFSILLPNAVQAGDALLLGITYPHGTTITITDTLGNKWPAATAMADAGTNNYASAVYVLPNAMGGNDTINVAGNAAFQPFQYTLSEFNNVATTSPVAGIHVGAALSPNASTAVIDPGAFTPANNNANGGNVIWNYTALATTSNGSANVRTWTSGENLTLLDADIAWTSNASFAHASQWVLQSTAAAIDPTITSSGDTADLFNSVTVALKAASSGGTLPTGIYVRKIIHQTNETFTDNSWVLQEPATGNIRVIEGPLTPSNGAPVSSITDSDGNTYTKANANQMIWYATGTSPDPNMKLTINFSSTPSGTSIRFFDIANGTAFDTSADGNTACSGVTSVINQPAITPTHAPGLVIAGMSIGQGPGKAVTSPAGAIWDLVTYTGETDLDTMENADAVGHIYNSGKTAQNWNWTITSMGDNTCTSEAAAFH